MMQIIGGPKNHRDDLHMELIKGLSGNLGRPTGLDDEIWEEVLSAGAQCALKAGARLFGAGDDFDFVFLLRKGWLMLRRENTVMDLSAEGELVGGPLALRSPLPQHYPIGAEALGPVETWRVPASAFATIASRSFALTNLLQKQLQDRVRFMHTCRLAQSLPMPQRLARMMMEKKDALASGYLTRKVLAQLASTSTESVIRTLSIWQRQGLIHRHGRKFSIPDPAKFLTYGNSGVSARIGEPS